MCQMCLTEYFYLFYQYKIGADFWIKVEDKDSFVTARRVMKEEGVMIGGSAGMAVRGAIQWALEQGDKLNEKDRVSS